MNNKAKKVSKFLRVGVEGATCDGRTINRQDIQDMAETYNPSVYNARVNLEHIKGVFPDSVFRAYGDVTAVKAEEIQDGPLKGKLALMAKIDPTDDLIAMNEKRQKIHTSMEIKPNFSDTGRAYLMGLAVTDSPASLGTEMLAFSANAQVNPLATRKTSPDCLFSAAMETEFTFEDEDAQPANQPNLLNRIKEMFSKQKDASNNALTDVHLAVEEVAKKAQEQDTKLSQLQADVNQVTALTQQVSQLQQDLQSLTQKLENTDANNFNRPNATGSNAAQTETDC